MRIQVVGRSKYFIPYRRAMVRAFNRAGCQAWEGDEPDRAGGADGFLVIGPHLYDPASLGGDDRVWGAIQTEQLANPLTGNGERLQIKLDLFRQYCDRFDFIFDWRRAESELLSRSHHQVEFLPHGVFDEIKHSDKRKSVDEVYDLCFIGDPTGVNGRRAEMLVRLEREFSVYPTYSGLWGKKKIGAMLQSRICLNLHFDGEPTFESPRLYETLALGRFVLSEKIADSYPFVENENYALLAPDDLTGAVRYWLSRPGRRQALSKSGRAKAEGFPLDKIALKVIGRFRARLTATY